MITVVIGTNRLNSKSRHVALRVAGIFSDLGEKVELLDLAELPKELFEPSAYEEKPAAFQPFVDKVLEARGLVIVTPEYNGSFPGALKYFIDMLPFPESFEGRSIAFIGIAAGQFGGLRPVEQLQQVFGYRNAYIYPNRVFIMDAYKAIDASGVFTDTKLVERLEGQAKGFVEFSKKFS